MLRFMQAGKERRLVLYYLDDDSIWVLIVKSSGRIDRTLFADDTLSTSTCAFLKRQLCLISGNFFTLY